MDELKTLERMNFMMETINKLRGDAMVQTEVLCAVLDVLSAEQRQALVPNVRSRIERLLSLTDDEPNTEGLIATVGLKTSQFLQALGEGRQ